MAPSYSGVWNISTQYQYRTGWPTDLALEPGIALIAGGYDNGAGDRTNKVETFVIETTANATDFGDLSATRYLLAGLGSYTRGVIGGGTENYSSGVSTMEYFTFASAGNATDFGDRTVSFHSLGGGGNATRGMFLGGQTGNTLTTVVDYITIASVGNATDFGDIKSGRTIKDMGCAGSTTRLIIAGGRTGSTTFSNAIEYFTIANTGNSTDFGDLSAARGGCGGVSSSTRFCSLGGYESDEVNTIEYVTIASTGDATDFGDMSSARVTTQHTVSNKIRGVVAGGTTALDTASGAVNIIEYITIASTGNTTDFGDLSATVLGSGSCSSKHGGLA